MINIKQSRSQAGFSLLEVTVALGIMMIVAGAAFSLMRDSMKVAVATYELTDAQENLRNSHEYLNRDLTNAGDGLLNINNLRVPQNFVSNYLTRTPITDPAVPVVLNLGVLTADNNVPTSTAVLGTTTTVRATPLLTDRITMLAVDTQFVPIDLLPAAINSTGSIITVSAADISRFAVGEVYFLTSSVGGTFGTITAIDTVNRRLTFANGDSIGLNLTGTNGHIRTISGAGTLNTSLQRMQIIHYFVDSNGLLVRRVFGVRGAAYTDSVIAEHIVSLQFRYVLALKDANGNVVQPVAQLTTSAQQIATRQVEITVTAETPRAIHNGVNNGTNQTLTMTTNASIRNMQFRRALQPGA